MFIEIRLVPEEMSLIKHALLKQDLRECEIGIDTGAAPCREYARLLQNITRQDIEQQSKKEK